eukprot:jgi/Astpho2/8904/Aster-x0372
MALCSLYANRWYTVRPLQRVSRRLGMKLDLTVWDQFVDGRSGMRMVTFVSEPQALSTGGKVAAAVFSFRGTRLNKSANLRADLQLMRDLDAELFVTQRATKKVAKHMHRLKEQSPDVQWGFFVTGHSLGGFTAASCCILDERILHAVTFESPGLTTFYHKLAGQIGNEQYWQERVTNYLALPNPINMCQMHLGRLLRVYTRIEARTDMYHICKCLFGTSIRILNWMLAANLCLTFLRILTGGVSSLWACFGILTADKAIACITGMHWAVPQAFDGSTGLPRRCVEMSSWPRMDRLGGSFWLHLKRALLESFFPTSTSEGVSVMFDRNFLIEARVRLLPGYDELIKPALVDFEAEPDLDFLTHNLFAEVDPLDVEIPFHSHDDELSHDEPDLMTEDELLEARRLAA